jgi:hypothetical protein
MANLLAAELDAFQGKRFPAASVLFGIRTLHDAHLSPSHDAHLSPSKVWMFDPRL